MSKIASILYREPIVFLGALLAGISVLLEQDIIGWPGLVAVAVIVSIQRHFVTPVGE